MRKGFYILGLVLIVCAMGIPVSAAGLGATGLYGTGYDSSGNPITVPNTGTVASPTNIPDGNWTYFYSATAPTSSNIASYIGSSGTTLYVVQSSNVNGTLFPFYDAVYAPNGWVPNAAFGGSQWIAPQSIYSDYTNASTLGDAPGYYTFQLSFNVTSGSSGSIVTTWAADNFLHAIYLNGIAYLGVTPNPSFGSTTIQPFTGFTTGLNTLDFVVDNTPNTFVPDNPSAGNPTGLNVSIFINQTPEPATFLLIGGGLVLLAAFRRRKS
ncbi:MAG: PEP-CTERM sorting domain-containing protein [Bryobacteraceae bacterium]